MEKEIGRGKKRGERGMSMCGKRKRYTILQENGRKEIKSKLVCVVRERRESQKTKEREKDIQKEILTEQCVREIK